MLSSHTRQSDNGCNNRQHSPVEEEKCCSVGGVDLPESKRDNYTLATQPHSLCVKTWNHCLWSQPGDLYSFLFNTRMSVESLLYTPWTFHEAQIDMADV